MKSMKEKTNVNPTNCSENVFIIFSLLLVTNQNKTQQTKQFWINTSLVGVSPVKCVVPHTKRLRGTSPDTTLFNSTGQRKHWHFEGV